MFQEEAVESYVSAKLATNAFNSANYVVRVPFTTVSTNGIITEIANDYPSINPYVIQHSLELVKAKILELLRQGRSVDVLELGTLYLKPDSTVTKDDPQVSDMPAVSVAFRVNSATKNALADVQISSFMVSDPAPQIQEVYNPYLASYEEVSAGMPVKVTGAQLKLAVNDSGSFLADNGIWFCPVDSSGEIVSDTSEWIAVDGASLYTNYPKTLEFFAPNSLMSGANYRIRIETTYLGKDTERKESVVGLSDIVAGAA